MNKIVISLSFIFILCCSNIELILNEYSLPNPIKNNVLVIASGEKSNMYFRELYSYFGNNNEGEYILTTTFLEKKENKVVKQNQVAEEIGYELDINYNLFYKNRECNILNKKIITKFTTSPKSFGYNFGADRSFEKLYISSIKKNIQRFVNSVPSSNNCIK